jgi:hypothetical protein
MRNNYKTLAGKPEGMRYLERSRCTSEDNITRSSGKNESPTFL